MRSAKRIRSSPKAISMAVQSAWLLCERLIGAPCAAACRRTIAREYEAA
jgi:hypothetical protein